MNDPQNPYPYSQPQPQAPPPAVPNPVTTPTPNRRNGKVAQLPKAVRDRINEMLLDGLTYAEIISELGDDGKSLNAENVSNWYSGGYQEWLKEQRRREDMRIRQELAMDLGRLKNGSDLSQAAFQIAVTQICETLADLDPAVLRKALETDPKNYTRLLNALPNLSEGELKCERHSTDAAERKARIEKEQAAPVLGLTEETREKIESERFNPPASS